MSELQPTAPPPARPSLARRLLAEGERLLAADKPAEALPLLLTATRAPGGDELAAWLALAQAQLDLESPDEAALACDAALRADAGNAAALVLRARAHGHRRRHQEALADAAAAVVLTPRDVAARIVLGQALLACDRFDEALSVLGEIWREAPAEPGGALRLADALMRASRHDACAELASFVLDDAGLPAGLRRQGLALRAQNALLRGSPKDAAEAAGAGLAEIGPDAALHSILAHALIRLGRNDEAWPHLRQASRLAPGDAYIAHLAASAGGEQPERATPHYVEHLFDGYAPGFEASLLGLGYRAPGLMLRALEQLMPGLGSTRRLGDVLDLGCGTGLVGVVLHDVVDGRLKGVDLSAGMLEEARLKGIYGSLEQNDIDTALARDDSRYEAVIAADVFCYFGALDATLAAIARRLTPSGWLLFTVEALDGADANEEWQLGASGRYRHAEHGLRRALRDAGLDCTLLRRETLRLERETALEGFLVAARPLP